MKFIPIDETTTYKELVASVGRAGVLSVLGLNGLQVVPDIGQKFQQICQEANAVTDFVSPARKISILSTFSSDSDVFEKAATLSEDAWKVLSKLGTFTDFLRVPEGVAVSNKGRVLGNGVPISKNIMESVFRVILGAPRAGSVALGKIVEIFSKLHPSSVPQNRSSRRTSSNMFEWFKIPWGEVTLRSSISGESIEFPVYPENPQDKRSANYITMPDMLYQYEPWQLYQGSGPRSNSYKFHMHRDMWTGDHRDGKANELIRACQATCYANYNGSLVNTPTVSLYVAGSLLISGIMTEVPVEWSGPIGLDGWYLEFVLTLNITEVSKEPLNYSSVKSLPLIG